MMKLLALKFLGCAVAEAAPAFPSEYTAVIEVNVPYMNFKMPMRVSTGAQAQKISYYDGLEVDIHRGSGNYKYAFNNSHRVCLYTSPEIGPARTGPGGNGGPPPPINDRNVTVLDFFPDLSQYALIGDELVGGIMCQRFDNHKHRGTSGIMDDHISFYWDDLLGKPVRWHMHSREKTFDAHTDEWIFDYIDFQPGAPSETDLSLPHECHVDPSVAPGAGMASAAQGLLAAAHGLRGPSSSEAAPLLWSSFVRDYGKTYASQAERDMRRRIFEENVLTVQRLRQQHAGLATFRGNYFLDMTREEMLRNRGGRRAGGSSREERRSPAQQELVRRHSPSLALDALPRNFDWRTERPGSVSPVKDQGFCGSCWTFGLMEPIESIQAIRTGEMTILPEQFVIDCTWDAWNFSHGLAQDGNAGCGGGYSDHGALEIVRKFGGVVPTAEAYGAYLNVDGFCKDTRLMATGAVVTGWVDVDLFDDHALRDALVTQGPISIGLMVPDELNYYDGGVLNTTDCQCAMDKIDHQVVLVGFGTDETSGLDYWLLRNSWSTYWGDEGYFKIARGKFDCCITSEAGYPEVAAVAALEAAAAPENDVVVVFA